MFVNRSLLILAVLFTTIVSFIPVKKLTPPLVKYGALAVDRYNGFYYGWAYDQPTLATAESRAVEECRKKGGNCSVVLSFQGTGCAAYRTIDGNAGTAFGWGFAATKEAADAIATKECLKRSDGKSPTSFVWSCNSKNAGPAKEIYNATDEIVSLVTIGKQVWMNKSLDVTTFRNGDVIPFAQNEMQWMEAGKAGKPIWSYIEYKPENGKKYGKVYNWYAVNDARGLAPSGFRIPTKDDWMILANYIGDFETLGGKLKSKTGWDQKNGTDDYGFTAVPGGNFSEDGSTNGVRGVVNFWSATASYDKYVYYFAVYGFYQKFDKLGNYPKAAGMYVRCLKE